MKNVLTARISFVPYFKIVHSHLSSRDLISVHSYVLDTECFKICSLQIYKFINHKYTSYNNRVGQSLIVCLTKIGMHVGEFCERVSMLLIVFPCVIK